MESPPAELRWFLLPAVILSPGAGFAAAAQPDPATQDCRAIHVPEGPQLLRPREPPCAGIPT